MITSDICYKSLSECGTLELMISTSASHLLSSSVPLSAHTLPQTVAHRPWLTFNYLLLSFQYFTEKKSLLFSCQLCLLWSMPITSLFPPTFFLGTSNRSCSGSKILLLIKTHPEIISCVSSSKCLIKHQASVRYFCICKMSISWPSRVARAGGRAALK